MVNTNVKSNASTQTQSQQLPHGLGIAGSVAWAKNKGLTSFSQLVIGVGVNPNQPNYNTATTASKRKVVLLNNAMQGKTVAQYYAAAKAKVPGSISTNNPLQAVKQGLITLVLPTK